MYQTRLDKLYISMRAAGLDSVVLNPGPTLTYLTGLHFHLMERPVVAFFSLDKDPVLVLPELEKPKLSHLPFPAHGFSYTEKLSEWQTTFNNALKFLALNGKAIGVEPRRLRLLEFQFIQSAAPRANFPDASQALGTLRLSKEPEEIASMRRAVQTAEKALEATLTLIKIGMTERELAAELTINLLKHGSDSELPFPPIVSSGPNSANPHASPSSRKLQAGDLLVIDWGANMDGYISDLTRTFAVGEISAELIKIHKIVQQANAAGRKASKPGLPCAVVDIAARNVIEEAGYGPYFTHRTGHGIGMEPHEEPYMRGDNQQLLAPGMTFTVEPGIYLPNLGGVRIEDDMLITETGAESLSTLPREIRQVG